MATKILEQSALLQETGAAISIAPNASPVLCSWGFDIAQARMVAIKTGSILNGSDMRMMVPNYYVNIQQNYGSPIYAVHRVDLHDQLKALATGEDGSGQPCKLHVCATVVAYVCELGLHFRKVGGAIQSRSMLLISIMYAGSCPRKSNHCRRDSLAGGLDHCSERCALDSQRTCRRYRREPR